MTTATPEMNIAADLARRAGEAPGRTALWFEDGRSWTYAALAGWAAAIADDLGARGLASGDRVAMCLPNRPELVAALFGAWAAGVVPVTISALYNDDELRKSVDRVDAKLVVAPAERLDAFAGEAVPTATLAPEPAAGAPGPLAPHAVDGDDDGVILFTGGTTGAPKAVRLSHGGVRGALARLARASKGGAEGPYPLAPPEVTPNLLTLPLFHSGGQHALLFAFHVGRSAVLCERFRVETVARLVDEHAIDNLFLLPTMIFDLVQAPDDVRLDTVRSVLVSGQALDPELRRRFEERFGVPILDNYGSTEIGHVAGWTSRDLREGRWKPGAAGRLYEGVEIEIRDEDGRALPRGEAGEIWVRTGITKGYVARDADAASVLVDAQGWVASGDMGRLDDDVLFLSGRKRDMIKTGGFQIWPAELETVLRTHPYVADAAVVGVPDPRMGEIPKALIVPTDAGRATDPQEATDELVALLREQLAHFKAARAVAFVDVLPRTAAGKVDRGALGREAVAVEGYTPRTAARR
jgi:long-chain acyl-CoA synthetase